MDRTVNIRLILFVCICLAVATIACYRQMHNYEFVNFDDDVYITDNPLVYAGLTQESILEAFTTTYAKNWHPLTWISHMLDYELYGLDPGWHHLTNLLLHIANSLLLFLVLERMTGAIWPSAFVAALFAVHPLRVESVAWVSERKDVLSTLFWMLTMFAYFHYTRNPRLVRYLLVLLLFALGLMSKPMLVTLPFALLLLDYWPLGRHRWGHLFKEKIPLFALAVASSIVTFFAQQSGGAIRSLEVFPLNVRIANALVSYVAYIGKMIWPLKLAVYYPHPITLPFWESAGAALVLVSISITAIRTVRRLPWFFVGWFLYIGTLLPVIGLVQVGSQGMADRYTYVPLIGLSIMIAWGVPELLSRWSYQRFFLAISAGIVLSALTISTWLQVGHWHTSITLFEHALRVGANNSLVHVNLGNALAEEGRVDEAIAHYSEAVRVRPDDEGAHRNWGNALVRLGRLDEAIAHYSAALRIKPDDEKLYNNQANALAKQGKLDEAIAHYSAALRIKPDYVKAHNNLGVALVRQGEFDEAIESFSSALKIKPDHAEARYNLELALRMADKAHRR